MKTFTISGNSFLLDGRKSLLLSGEIHYFRIRRELWGTHLDAALEAGLDCVSTYVPWAWHEPEEGVFDFDGTSCPERDLLLWLRLCKDKGLRCILKPGPFILAEYRGAGIPDWFLEKHAEEAKMRNSRGEMVMSDGLSLFNSKFLEKVGLWYDNIMPILSRHQLSAGGPVIMMQVCNEIGVFSWLAHQADYGNMVKGRFVSWLSEKYGDIQQMNKVWGTGYRAFDEAELPPDGQEPYHSPSDRARDHDWHSFWRRYYGDYLRMLTAMARKRGVTLPLYHNLPGWIYGHGSEFPVNITMYDDLYGTGSDILFGVDHIPEFLSHRNLHDDRIINDTVAAMQGGKPLFAAEFQCGSREYHVVTNAREMELFYKASLANGLAGWNFYMFSQGRNPRHKGYSGDTFYWYTALSAEGRRNSLFPVVKRMNHLAKVSEGILVQAQRRAETAVLFYSPYYATELERPAGAACSLRFIPSAVRRPAYFDGLLKALQVLNVDYDMLDLRNINTASLGRYKQLWAFTTDEMDAVDQQKIIDYAASGGQAVIFPYLPDRELSQRPCSIIRDALAMEPSAMEIIDSPLADLFDLKDIKCANPLSVFDEKTVKDAEIIARDLYGHACGFIMPLGKGSVIHLGTWLGFDTEGHKHTYEALLNKSGARLRYASSDNDFLIVRERFSPQGKACLFVGNYYNEGQKGRVSYTHPLSGETVTMPYDGQDMLWPALYAVMTPLCLDIDEGLSVLHCTSDILGIKSGDKGYVIEIYGDRDLKGEIVFEGRHAIRLYHADLDGDTLAIHQEAQRAVISYRHKHGDESLLTLKLRL